uniref:Mitochondrial pyruvate carrier n=1 Tax=Calidris pygmaea TaxID=425635 RepID=A0A8C3KI31_9CHAR
MAAAVAGLRASYHRLLDRIELMLPPRFRPFYNHPAGPKTVFFWAPIMKWVSIICHLLCVCQSEGNLQQPIEQAVIVQQISEPTERFNIQALIFNIQGGTKLALITYSTTRRGYSRGKMLCGKIVLFTESFTKAFSCETLNCCSRWA